MLCYAMLCYGVQGLRVADASVMPLIPNVNTDLTTRVVGYRLAEMILAETAARGDHGAGRDGH